MHHPIPSYRLRDLPFHLALLLRAHRYQQELYNRIESYQSAQLALALRLDVRSSSPTSYSDDLRERIIGRSRNSGEQHELIETSGTTSQPKLIFYPQDRLDRLQRECLSQLSLLYDFAHLRHPSIYFLTSLRDDRSLSRALFRHTNGTSKDFAFRRSIVGNFLPSALSEANNQLWIHIAAVLLLRPSFLAAANPSSVLLLIRSAIDHWKEAPLFLPPVVHHLLNSVAQFRLAAGDRKRRLGEIDELLAQPAVSPRDLFPRLDLLACWTGGYVRPYLLSIQRLFGASLNVLPLFSLSTETVCGVLVPEISNSAILPIYPGVVYEFQTESRVGTNRLKKPWELRPGETGSMIVSDTYGLTRYDTEDLFECQDMVEDVPLLTFAGRRGLQHSFTGEKLTAEQLLLVYQIFANRAGVPDRQFVCFPNRAGVGGEVPNYSVLMLLPESTSGSNQRSEQLSKLFDRVLSEVNSEYRAKRQSGRLGPPEFRFWSAETFVRRMQRHSPSTNLSQLKVLPLYPKIDWSTMI